MRRRAGPDVRWGPSENRTQPLDDDRSDLLGSGPGVSRNPVAAAGSKARNGKIRSVLVTGTTVTTPRASHAAAALE